ncbi:MAG: FHA domain-containing protein [Candidatus Lernaella stagnicola]|nr:FHA domain-containing protein [Candidatus Lernaella stagnicola]
MKALVRVVDGQSTFRYPITGILQRIGRDPSCEIFLDGEEVSRRHAELTQTHEGIFIRDLESGNGTFLNAQRIAGLTPVQVGDRVGVGKHLLVLIEEKDSYMEATTAGDEDHARHLRLPAADFPPEVESATDDTTVIAQTQQLKADLGALTEEGKTRPRLVIATGPKRGSIVVLTSPEIEIGRSPEAHLVLPDNQVSAAHARVVSRKGAHYIYDNRSLNGVLVNGSKVRGVPLKSGDHIQLGETVMVYEDPAHPVPSRPVEVVAVKSDEAQSHRWWLWVAGGTVILAAAVAVALFWF